MPHRSLKLLRQPVGVLVVRWSSHSFRARVHNDANVSRKPTFMAIAECVWFEVVVRTNDVTLPDCVDSVLRIVCANRCAKAMLQQG